MARSPATKVQVPDVVDLSVDEAIAAMEAATLVIEFLTPGGSALAPRRPVDSRKIKSQTTAAGTMVDAGSVISVIVTVP